MKGHTDVFQRLWSILTMAARGAALKARTCICYPIRQSWINPSCKLRLDRTARLLIGKGAIIGEKCLVTLGPNAHLVIGAGSMVGRFSEITVPSGSKFVIGEKVYIGSGANLRARGGITIGNHVQIGQYVSLVSGQYNFDDLERPVTEQGFSARHVTIHSNAWLGAGVIVLPGRAIGRGAIVGAGSVVTKDVDDGTIVAGNPAKFVKKR